MHIKIIMGNLTVSRTAFRKRLCFKVCSVYGKKLPTKDKGNTSGHFCLNVSQGRMLLWAIKQGIVTDSLTMATMSLSIKEWGIPS